MASSRDVPQARVVVGADFGTTFSGFAYAHIVEPDAIHTVYDWPMQFQGGGKPYCKTRTSLLYAASAGHGEGKRSWRFRKPAGACEVVEWGWPAHVAHLAKSDLPREGAATALRHNFVERFKLLLAREAALGTQTGGGRTSRAQSRGDGEGGVSVQLPQGVTVERAVSDFLGKLAQFAVEHLQSKYGSHITMREVQWCITVPAIWDEQAKQQMIECAERAGMVVGDLCPAHMADSASPHAIHIVLESEAASVYCARRRSASSQVPAGFQLRSGDEFMVADAGGGTVDIVVHKQVDDNGLQFQEVAEGSGGMCGCTFVDMNFGSFLAQKIPCFRQYVRQFPSATSLVLRRWEEIKRSFDGSEAWSSAVLELPRRLAAAWEQHCSNEAGKVITKTGTSQEQSPSGSLVYDEVEITSAEMRLIFDPVVEQVTQLIEAQLSKRPGLKALMVVGGFSASPYLMKRIREQFSSHVEHIVNPPEPGSAICQGAVAMGIHPLTVVSRIARRTYGQATSRPFRFGEDPWSSLNLKLLLCGRGAWRSHIFHTFVQRGDAVAVDQSVSKTYSTLSEADPSIRLEIFSSPDVHPSFTNSPGSRLEGTLIVDTTTQSGYVLSYEKRQVKTTMHFGRTMVQVTAQRINFGDRSEMLMFKYVKPMYYN